jgi:lipid-binding SYLF domain-containing protein
MAGQRSSEKEEAMRKANYLLAALVLLLGVTVGQAGELNNDAKNEAAQRVQEAARVVDEIMMAPDKGIPRDLLADASCVAVIPSMKQGGFVFGAQYGKGVMTCRHAGTGWTGPSTVRIEGGSWGAQIGGAATDVVLLIMNHEGAHKLMESQFTLGGDVTVAAGPVGRKVEAETDALLHAKILAYSRSRGLFAGATINGATLRVDDDDNRELYGREVDHKSILEGAISAPPSGNALAATLKKYSIRES